MSKGTLPVAAAILAAWAAGCATHVPLSQPVANLARAGVVRDPQQVSLLEKSITDKDIATLLDAKVQAKLPTSLAIAKLASYCGGYQPYLATIDAEELQAWEKLMAGGFASRGLLGVHPVARVSVSGDPPSLHELRTAAARMNCELLLVYLQADSSVENFNDAAVLYWTFIGLWTVPGSEIEHRTVMQAILVDCRTGMILATATGDCHMKRSFPAAFEDIRRAELAKMAPVKALADLQESFRSHLGRVVTAAVARQGAS